MQNILLVGIGGALGAISRYAVNQAVVAYIGSSLIGTFIANTSGSFILGLLTGLFSVNSDWSSETRIFIAVGFLGSYTTFSTLTVATVESIQKGDLPIALVNVLGSIVTGLLAAFVGILVGRAI